MNLLIFLIYLQTLRDARSLLVEHSVTVTHGNNLLPLAWTFLAIFILHERMLYHLLSSQDVYLKTFVPSQALSISPSLSYLYLKDFLILPHRLLPLKSYLLGVLLWGSSYQYSLKLSHLLFLYFAIQPPFLLNFFYYLNLLFTPTLIMLSQFLFLSLQDVTLISTYACPWCNRHGTTRIPAQTIGACLHLNLSVPFEPPEQPFTRGC